MYRIIGMAFVVVSCGGFFWKKIQSLSKKYSNLKELKKAVIHLKHELSHSVCELPRIFEKISRLTEDDVSLVFENIGTELTQNEISDMKRVWKTSGGENLLLPENAKKVAEELIYNIGKKELDTEIEKINNTIISLDEIEAEEKVKTQKDKKLLYTIGVSCAAAIVILFI